MVLLDDTNLNTEVMNSMVISNEDRKEKEQSSETLIGMNTEMVNSMVISEEEETETVSETLLTMKSMVIDNQEEEGGEDKGSEIILEAVDLKSAEIDGSGGETKAVLKMQKAYRGYRTRRKLADSAVLAEEYWWQAIDFARLNHSTISFFNMPETPISRWNRVALNASKVGKGAAKDAKARKLAFQHWIEAIDSRHRYGHSLHLYYEEWSTGDAGQPFFYWLDIGDGKNFDLKECPRSKLRQQCIKYLGPQEREHYEYIIINGIILHKLSGELMDTSIGSEGAKWIFVMSTSKKLYGGEKKKGCFHHSSFLAGGTTLAAGRLVAENGKLKTISAYSGHYRPTEENLDSFKDFLSENGVNLDEVQIRSSTDDYESNGDSKSVHGSGSLEAFANKTEASASSDSLHLEIPNGEVEDLILPEPTEGSLRIERKASYKRTLSGGLQSPRADVPKIKILERINSKKATSSYQLGHQLSRKWSTGAGPRIGCVADYPLEIQQQALEFVNLSPRTTPATSQHFTELFPSSPRSENGSVSNCNVDN
ncbi:hypothetical protein C5167_041892 [Papaver somniferum]|uniref:IQ domain-containing protein IQM3-like n=1 Tax=Papaver somniferum TaxID=3469 RepID=UPI000E6F6A2C|nr:IQ domain-containing protein IQM3-like [Papaver somniferum]RZC93111.1 hypothetical protein C5167_041892 [Papaver somniferum]